MQEIKIKPLSVNDCWQGKRYKTKKYKQYEEELLWLLPEIELPEKPYDVYYEFGFSNKGADYDNAIKPLQDILQKRYGFDDKHIMHAEQLKVITKKGQEYIKFNIKHYADLSN